MKKNDRNEASGLPTNRHILFNNHNLTYIRDDLSMKHQLRIVWCLLGIRSSEGHDLGRSVDDRSTRRCVIGYFCLTLTRAIELSWYLHWVWQWNLNKTIRLNVNELHWSYTMPTRSLRILYSPQTCAHYHLHFPSERAENAPIGSGSTEYNIWGMCAHWTQHNLRYDIMVNSFQPST